MIKGMFVGLDESPVAESVIPHVTKLAAALAAPVTLLTVIDRLRSLVKPLKARCDHASICRAPPTPWRTTT